MINANAIVGRKHKIDVGRRYDVGDKQGYLEATVEYALRRPDLKDKFLEYLKGIVGED